eukprot:CAMPEP_0171643896 /NCGR_PEP_ID=MMETSP0990-20121206/33016_1 /TAXON_ID=483369 /ORGANISM="non described non described, Strain CCMP2098" /LENGTH=99 /DNA_ID=CAMNT_0012219781 /DNA_START=212 /DNA_END=511 /DNA_ORIENTATION=-
MHVLGKDGGVLHTQEPSAAQLAGLDVQVKLATALGLPGVVPVHSLRPHRVERDGNDGSLRVRVRREAADHVSDLGWHAVTVVSLRAAPFYHPPLLGVLV